MPRTSQLKAVELLAPAGNAEALRAAVRAGADAVYLGLESFNARRGADNFTLEGLAEACEYAHLRGVRVYVALNTAVLPSELSRALETARQAYRAGADAFIVQDIGVAAELSRSLPEARLHVSTQMNTHNAAGIEAAARLGAKRVTLARELSLIEVAHLVEVADGLGMEVESFAHGALCVCYSGQCFMSSLIGGRSANRGMCAQACRLPYTLHNKAQRKNLPSPGEHLLSPRDLCTIDLLPSLVHAGVASLKIEGRMKSPDYVYSVVGVYRAVLDRALAARDAAAGGGADAGGACDGEADERSWTRDPSVHATDDEHRALAEAFSRGFTTAYLEGARGNGIMSYGRPNNRGVLVGRVASVKDGVAAVAAERALACGDVLEFWTNKGHFTYALGEVAFDRDGNVRTFPDRPVGKGDRVFRVRSAQAAYEDDPRLPRVPVRGRARLRLGEPLRVEFSLAPEAARRMDAGALRAVGAAEGDPVEPARTKPVDAEDVRAHIDRLGQTPFALAELEIELDEGAGVGFSQLHRVRAAALEDLRGKLLAGSRDRVLPRVSARSAPAPVRPRGCRIAAWATNPACARAAKRAGADLVYVPALNYKRGEAVIAGQRSATAEQAGYPKQVVPVLPVVEHDPVLGTREEELGFDAWRFVKPGKPVMAESLGALVRAADLGCEVELGPHVPVTNTLSLAVAAELGASRVWLSPELTLGQIADLAEDAPVELGLTIIGFQELMVTEHCLLMSQGPCDQDCDACPRRKSPHFLRDRKEYEFPVVTDALGRSHLYNGVQLDVAHAVPDLVRAGIGALMVDTTLMNVEETTRAVARAVRARSVAHASGDAIGKVPGTTSGHLFRGVS
ncbi:peptidase U32 [Gordonibacter sp. An230]|uniref:U32 family peptidase n=1 Tax=Gordonibacter sp. An230 TaxID=1965592 RepID=UPI000B38A1A7|nr:U32 family peptidase [Gordonibacter sp. An230]OUO87123.1 peptidase U32 [Gordonibacter sp. An230]